MVTGMEVKYKKSFRLGAGAAGLLVVGIIVYGLVTIFSAPSQWDLLQPQFSEAQSGTMIELENGDVYFNQYSFFAADGRLCRAYYAGEDDLTEGLVCWDTEEDEWQYMLTESGPGSVSRDQAPALMQQAMRELQPGATLSVADERDALAALNEQA